jgi:meso-butanediol dehydrogenase/(S,S)-butanediol dehydrogenase/diacetyl reductase
LDDIYIVQSAGLVAEGMRPVGHQESYVEQKNELRLAGKVAVITGTGGGQGRAAALRFAAAGARVVGCDLKADGAQETLDLVTSRGGEMISLHPLDLTDEIEVGRLLEAAVETYGGLDILYNNAALARGSRAEDMSRGDWDWTMSYDLTLMFLTIKHAIPLFRSRGSGVVINVASSAGISGAAQAMLAHSVAKAGVIRMTSFLAVELSPLNVRVNCISPGPIDSPALRATFGAEPGHEPDWGNFTKHSLVARIGRPDDIAAAALFLASDEASFITGVNLPVDGGAFVGSRREPAAQQMANPAVARWAEQTRGKSD